MPGRQRETFNVDFVLIYSANGLVSLFWDERIWASLVVAYGLRKLLEVKA